MGRAFGLDNLIIKEVTRGFMGESNGLIGIIRSFSLRIPKIFLIIITKKCMDSAADICSPFIHIIRSFIRRFLYRTLTYQSKDKESLEFHRAVCAKNVKVDYEKKFPPIYIDEDINGAVRVSYIPRIHALPIKALEDVAKSSLEKFMKPLTDIECIFKSYTIRNSIRGLHNVGKVKCLFPSKNFVKLAKSVSSYFDTSALTGASNVLGILINGPPGLGKTKFADYAVHTTLAHAVYKIDLTSFLATELSDVLNGAYYGIAAEHKRTIFLIDEIDKYIDTVVRSKYDAKFNVLSPEDRETFSFVEFSGKIKSDILFKLLGMLERDDISNPIVVIFCTNNFDTILQNVDITHHRSTLTRLWNVTFEKCDRADLADYIDYYNQKFINTEYHQEITRDQIYNSLRADILVTHRELHQLSISANYNPLKLVDLLNQENPLESLPIPGSSYLVDVDGLNPGPIPHVEPIVAESTLETDKPAEHVNTVDEPPKTDRTESEIRESVMKTLDNIPMLEDSDDDYYSGDESEKSFDFNIPDNSDKYMVKQSDVDNAEQAERASQYHIKFAEAGIAEYKKDIPNNKLRCCKDIKELLTQNENARGRENKAKFARQLFATMAHDPVILGFIEAEPKFKEAVINKIKDFRECEPDWILIDNLDTTTSEFMYLLAGAK